MSCSTRNTSPCNLCIMTLVISIGFAILLSSKPSSFETQLKWYGILRKAHVICCINWPNSTYLKHNSYDTLGYDLGRPILKIIFCCPFKVLMSFDGPDQILPIFHHLMTFDGPKNLMSFDGPKSRFSPYKISCLLMDPIFTYIFKVFPSKTSCLLMDPLLN